MKTNNRRLTDIAENQKYYSKSDSNFMDIKACTKAHLILDRIAWAREWVHKLGSQYHLDVGCKDGYFDLTLASEGIECVGIDPSVDAIEEANLRASELDLEGARFMVSTVEAFEGRFRFDTVSMLEVLEHVINPDEVVKKLAQSANFVLISTPDVNGSHGLKDSEQNEEHIQLYSKEELEVLCGKYGDILECAIRDEQLLIVFKSAL